MQKNNYLVLHHN